MKKILGLLLGIALSFPAFSLESDTTKQKSANEYHLKTVFGNHGHHCNIALGYFLELNGGYTQFGAKNVFLTGIQMGLILNHHWTFGLAGSFIGNSRNLFYEDIYYSEKDFQIHGAYLGGGYGGVLFEYTLLPRSVVHISFPLIVGGGYMYYQEGNFHHDSLFNSHNHHNNFHSNVISGDYFFVIEPGVKVEFNIFRKLRLGLGVSYRYTPDLKLENNPSDLINQFTGRLTLRFGKF
jgi:hypothetical protein